MARISRKIIVISKDRDGFECTEDDLKCSLVLRAKLEDNRQNGQDMEIELPFETDTLRRVLWWMRNYTEEQTTTEESEVSREPDAWNKDFLKCHIQIVMRMIRVANYLNIKQLMNLCLDKLAKEMNKKMCGERPVAALRAMFDIPAEALPESDEFAEISNFIVYDLKSRKPSAIDPLLVPPVHLPPRRLEEPDEKELNNENVPDNFD